MEDALARQAAQKYLSASSLNPCCNGRCTRTYYQIFKSKRLAVVLILVVMEDALAPSGRRM